MSIISDNLLRLYSGGYGGAGDPNLEALRTGLLADAAKNLASRRLKKNIELQEKGLALREKELQERIKALQEQIALAKKRVALQEGAQNWERRKYFLERGYGTEQEQLRLPSEYGYTQLPGQRGLLYPSGMGRGRGGPGYGAGYCGTLMRLPGNLSQLGVRGYQLYRRGGYIPPSGFRGLANYSRRFDARYRRV